MNNSIFFLYLNFFVNGEEYFIENFEISKEEYDFLLSLLLKEDLNKLKKEIKERYLKRYNGKVYFIFLSLIEKKENIKKEFSIYFK